MFLPSYQVYVPFSTNSLPITSTTQSHITAKLTPQKPSNPPVPPDSHILTNNHGQLPLSTTTTSSPSKPPNPKKQTNIPFPGEKPQSLRIVPSPTHPTSTTNLSTKTPTPTPSRGAPSAPGIHDTLRANLTAEATATANGSAPTPTVTSAHPLESRLAAWTATQDQLKMNGLRRTFGIGEPVRRGMEMKIAREGEWRPSALGGSAGVSGDVLSGRDCECSWEDVFRGDGSREGADFHAEMEGRLRMDW